MFIFFTTHLNELLDGERLLVDGVAARLLDKFLDQPSLVDLARDWRDHGHLGHLGKYKYSHKYKYRHKYKCQG